VRSRSFKLILIVSATALAFSACGGSKGPDTGTDGGKVTAKAFAHSVCSAVLQWQADIQKRSGDVSTQLGTSPDAAKGKQVLGDFIDGIITDTDTVITKLKGAGTPDVDQGQTASDALVNAFQQVKTSLTGVRTSIDGLPTDDPVAFQQAATNLSTSISSSFDSVATSLKDVKVPALDDAFNADTACSSVQAA
jgi:hypothetical protein